MSAPLRINLGAGQDQFEGFVNLDLVPLPGIDVVHNLMNFPYPFDDESAVEIRCVDALEHLANYTADGRPSVVAFIEECYRILKPLGELYIRTPGYDAEFLWEDPTHVRGFAATSMDFFDPSKPYGQTTGFYSKAHFDVRAEKLENCNLRFHLTKRLPCQQEYTSEQMNTDEKSKISQGLMGHKVSEETRRKIGMNQPRQWLGKTNEDTAHWKGDKVGYYGLHEWVRKQLGRPLECSLCMKSGGTTYNYHWANLSHQYKRDLSDWRRHCVSCHKLYDLRKLVLS